MFKATHTAPASVGPLIRKAAACLGLSALATVFCLAPAYADDQGNAVNPYQLPDSSFLYDTSIGELNTADSYLDNQTVQVVGEAVGDCLAADAEGNYRWITLASLDRIGNATISTYVTKEDAQKIGSFGKYGVMGTTLQVRGVFHLVCPMHDGATDLHAEYATVVDQGRQHADEFDPFLFVPGIVVVAAGLGLLLFYYNRLERQR